MAPPTTISIQLPWEIKKGPTSFHLITEDLAVRPLETSSYEVTQVQVGCGIYRDVKSLTEWGRLEQLVKPQIILFCSPSGEENDAPTIVLKAFFHTDAASNSAVLQEEWEECQEVMKREATLYGTALSTFQDVIVPKHYGLWRSDRTSSVGVIQCQILQFGGRNLLGIHLNPNQSSALARAVETLHNHGIYHGKLTLSQLDQHVVCNNDNVLIIDFAEAGVGLMCTRTIPIVPMQISVSHFLVGNGQADGNIQLCHELALVTRFLGFDSCEQGYSEEELSRVASMVVQSGRSIQDKIPLFERQRRELEETTLSERPSATSPGSPASTHVSSVFDSKASEASWLSTESVTSKTGEGESGTGIDVAEDRKNKDKMQLCDELQHVARFLGFGWCDSGRTLFGKSAQKLTIELQGYPTKILEETVTLIAGRGNTVEERKIYFERQRQRLEGLMAASSEPERTLSSTVLEPRTSSKSPATLSDAPPDIGPPDASVTASDSPLTFRGPQIHPYLQTLQQHIVARPEGLPELFLVFGSMLFS
ncbi:hypothetical protein VNI00_010390 [Paramarasmius palmivorus]|uniref:Protein kinase domain-containing protein n=1 Tax=Paramarasmius palmivorus TaxID=297713 RepID=A0AAW0BRN0_9AGAR